MRKRILASVLVLTMAASALTGCTRHSSSTREYTDFEAKDIKFETNLDLTNDNITLTVWESKEGPDTFIKEAGKKFTELYPNIKIKYVNVESTDANSKIALDGPAGTGADLFACAHNNIGPLTMS